MTTRTSYMNNADDNPLIVQFAANNAHDLASAAQFVAAHVAGVDLNCGCPQRWAMAEGYGSHLINHPELVSDMVKQTRNRVGGDNERLSISIKIRIHKDLNRTVELCRRAEAAGVSYLTVHGRTPSQRTEPVDYKAIATIKQSLRIPVYANGDITSKTQAINVAQQTGVDGVMSARGILHNPALFDTDNELVDLDCVRDWVDTALNLGLSFALFHQQLVFMLDAHLNKAQRRVFNRLQSVAAVLDFLDAHWQI